MIRLKRGKDKINNDIEIYKGNIIFTKTMDEFTIIPNGYIIVKGSKVLQTASVLPEAYKDYYVNDYGDQIIIPGFVDLHIHAAQYHNRGLCLDDPLIVWLFNCTFPEERKFSDINYAKMTYELLINRLYQAGTTRSLIYNTIHQPATELLMDMFIDSGLGAYIGKVNMDINAPDYLLENTLQSLVETEQIIRKYKNKSELVKPIIAPRFVPACSKELMSGLGLLAQVYDVPVMSHLSEELEEIKIVKEMYPDALTYASIYNQYGLFGQQPTVMAHSVYSDDAELGLIKHNDVFIAHCPTSNCILGSGMMPARKFLNRNIRVGLGSDIAGGGVVSMFQVMSYAISVSKMIQLMSSNNLPALKTHEVFYLGTKGGGQFFGKVGSFEPGYDFDALIVNDADLNEDDYTLSQRIDRLVHLGEERHIIDMYVAGKNIVEPYKKMNRIDE